MRAVFGVAVRFGVRSASFGGHCDEGRCVPVVGVLDLDDARIGEILEQINNKQKKDRCTGS